MSLDEFLSCLIWKLVDPHAKPKLFVIVRFHYSQILLKNFKSLLVHYHACVGPPVRCLKLNEPYHVLSVNAHYSDNIETPNEGFHFNLVL